MKTNSRFLLVAALGLALVFTFSCSEQPANDTNGNNEQGDNNQQGNNSGGENQQGNQQQPPATPTGLRAAASSNSILLNWNAVAGASGYNLYLAYNSQSEWYYIPDLQGTSYAESGLPEGTYYFALTAYNANGESDKSNIVSATITDGGTTTPSSSSRANTTVSSNSNTANGSEECNGYCKWDTGCVRIATDPTGEYGSVISTCAAAISNCTSYSPSKQTYANSTCTGGTTTPSSSSRANTTVSSNSNTASGSVECSGYCKWDTGCVRISTDPTGLYGSAISTCAAAISNCQTNSPSKQTYANSTCTGGTTTQSSGSNLTGTKGTFTDSRDSKNYKWVKIGNQFWMAENLSYNDVGGKCYSYSEANCTEYGLLYNWAAAKTACPSGWHLPSSAEWNTLMTAVGGASTAGIKLRATNGWNNRSNGTDDYGFAALPGGSGNALGSFGNDVGNSGYWWSDMEDVANYAYGWAMTYNVEAVSRYSDNKDRFLSVRCLQN